MKEASESEVIELDDLGPEQWNEYVFERGWSDGCPRGVPTEAAGERFTATCRGDNEPFAPISPRRVIPTLRSLAANAVMAGCRPEY